MKCEYGGVLKRVVCYVLQEFKRAEGEKQYTRRRHKSYGAVLFPYTSAMFGWKEECINVYN